MKNSKPIRYANLAYFFIFFPALIFASVYKFNLYVNILNIIISLFLIGIWLINGVKVKIPKSFILYLLFIISLYIHWNIFGGQVSFLYLFISSGAIWVIFYNLKNYFSISKFFMPFLIFFSLMMTFLYIGALTIGVKSIDSNNLFLPLYEGGLHNHLGDIWSVTTVGVIYIIMQKRNIKLIPVVLAGLFFVLISFSRSAIVSLAIGVGYLYYYFRRDIKNKYILPIIIFLLSAAFLYFGLHKTTIFSRPYIGESINSLVRHPLGIGIGNFKKASPESALAHNLILEFTTGMGVFSAVFIIWLGVIINLFLKQKTNPLLLAIILSIFTNFMFDTTYTIPAMDWLFFASLGLVFTEDFDVV